MNKSIKMPRNAVVFALVLCMIASFAPNVHAINATTAQPTATVTVADVSKLAVAGETLHIDKIQVVDGGAVQSLYRRYNMLQEGDKWYIDLTHYPQYGVPIGGSFTDPRIMSVSATFDTPKEGITAEQIAAKLEWTYGGQPFSEWKKCVKDPDQSIRQNAFVGEPMIKLVGTPKIAKVAAKDQFTLTADVLFDAAYDRPLGTDFDDMINKPYDPYYGVEQHAFTTTDSARVQDLVGTYPLSVTFKDDDVEKELAKKDIVYNFYDSFRTWEQVAKEARALKELGDANKFEGRYLKVETMGTTYEGRPVWNAVLSDSKASVDDYLKAGGTRDQMAETPSKLIPEVATGNQKIPLYFNNVHPDETPATDAMLTMLYAMLYEDNVSYNTIASTTEHKWDDTYKGDAYFGNYGYTAENGNKTNAVNLNVEDVLDKFILVFNFTSNPDGRNAMTRRNSYEFDLNRDATYQTQKETVLLTQDIVKWDPLTFLEFHGFYATYLIDACTGPHNPNYEYDLLGKNIVKQAHVMGDAVIGDTNANRYTVPADHFNDGWDDGAPIYGPAFAMLFGALGYTFEMPYCHEDSHDGTVSAGFALINDCLERRTELLTNKLTYKQRGIDNVDAKALIDPLLIDPYTDTVVGRLRNGHKNYFPEFYLIPVDETNQKNVLEAYKMLQVLMRNKVKLTTLSEATTVKGVDYPIGTYVIDMHQANRGYVNVVLSEGEDSSLFKAVYAAMVINFPAMRGFTATQVFAEDLTEADALKFKGNTMPVKAAPMPTTAIEGDTKHVLIKNNNLDAVKLVVKMLNAGKPVQMLISDDGAGKSGDYVFERTQLNTYGKGFYVEGHALTTLPSNKLQQMVKPNMSVYGTKAHSRFVFEQLLGMVDGTNFTYTDKPKWQEGTNVILANNNDVDVSETVKNGYAPYIGVYNDATQYAAKALLPGLEVAPPDEDYDIPFEGLFKATYSKDNLLTARYDQMDTVYISSGAYFTTVPKSTEVLAAVSTSEDYFVAGWYPTEKRTAAKGKAVAVTGFTGDKKDVPVTLFADDIFNKAHAQYMYNMLATSIFTSAMAAKTPPVEVEKAETAETEKKSTKPPLYIITGTSGLSE